MVQGDRVGLRQCEQMAPIHIPPTPQPQVPILLGMGGDRCALLPCPGETTRQGHSLWAELVFSEEGGFSNVIIWGRPMPSVRNEALKVGVDLGRVRKGSLSLPLS